MTVLIVPTCSSELSHVLILIRVSWGKSRFLKNGVRLKVPQKAAPLLGPLENFGIFSPRKCVFSNQSGVFGIIKPLKCGSGI